MFNVEKIKGHFRKLDWPGCLDLIGTVEPERKADVAARLVKEIILNGCLIIRRKDQRLENKRKDFVEGITEFLADIGDQETIDNFTSHLDDCRMIETSYREILRTLSKSKAAQRTPEQNVWLPIAMVGNAVMSVQSAILPSLRKVQTSTIFLSRSMTIRDEQGHTISPDPYIWGLIDVLGITVKMLA